MMDGPRLPFCRPSLLSQDIYIKKSHLYFLRGKFNIHYVDQSTTQLVSLELSVGLILASQHPPPPLSSPVQPPIVHALHAFSTLPLTQPRSQVRLTLYLSSLIGF